MAMKVGAEPKKVATLVGLLVVAGAVYFYNSSQTPQVGDPGPATTTRAPQDLKAPAAPPPIVASRPAVPGGPRRTGSRQQLRGNVQEFKPKLYDKDNPVDPTKVDPMLSTSLIARLQDVKLAGGGRSLFDFGNSAPAVDVPKGPIIKPGPAKPKGTYLVYGPEKPPPPPPPPVKAPPPPIPLKFYGFVNSRKNGPKRAFFMEGEDIYIAGEGESMKNNKYRLIRIGVNSALVEDTSTKHQQSLPLIEEQNPGD
ncbi:hypothetical protein F183_A49370 [Bryobacterales bacterium F-183]|nr:hypothetical protein F183_A49370 [Bryobacterales bacterium F-183]